MKFKIGQKVVALTNPMNNLCQPRIKGNVYIVLDVSYCSKCGVQSINITTNYTHHGEVLCGCGNNCPSQGKFWTDSILFAPLDNLEATIAELAEKEEYEVCAMLQKILDEQTVTL